MQECTRREFLKQIAMGAAVMAASNALAPIKLFGAKENVLSGVEKTKLNVFSGKDYTQLIRQGFEEIGGIEKFVGKNSYVVIKPNASWSRTPEQAGNTHPLLVSETIKLCLQAGAKKVDVIDHCCDNYKSAFKISGIAQAVKQAGGKMIALSTADTFREVTIPKAKQLKNAAVAEQLLDADCFINMPIAKDHSAATLTMAMKNYMGVVKDRWVFHSKDLHQCIADISSFIKPNLVIMDCTRILLTNGPKGPGKVKILDKIVMGTDHVAVDALGTTYFGLKPNDIKYLKIAGQMGIGQADLNKIQVVEKQIA